MFVFNDLQYQCIELIALVCFGGGWGVWASTKSQTWVKNGVPLQNHKLGFFRLATTVLYVILGFWIFWVVFSIQRRAMDSQHSLKWKMFETYKYISGVLHHCFASPFNSIWAPKWPLQNPNTG